MSCKWIAPVLAAGLLAACQSVDPVSQSPDPSFGEVTARNKIVQVINPDPAYPADAAQPGDNGERSAAAVDRYEKGNVKQTVRVSTGGTGGGSGDSGSGSGPN
ncbi:hypothetical protein [Sphingomonas sp. LHG3406-1]|uniref:hypothetical protein n=1 Tax=Sphingomonas sp. LHG3406-1 TaxID=2804617 RepID=UPI00260FDAAF|nr:hypothetical protein [Sphingomonas sp. LHG3406-1]